MLAPRRMFLGELPLYLHKNSINPNYYKAELRLMGRVIYVSQKFADKTSSSLPSCQANENQPQQMVEDVTIFLIDDGTASLDVVTITTPPSIEMGQLVDCIGKIQFAPESEEGQYSPNKPPTNYYFEAKTVSLINNPQEETLRQLELSQNTSLSLEMQDPIFNTSLHKIPKNRILASPHLQQKLNPLHHVMHPFPSITLNIDDAFRYISYSGSHGGLSVSELECLVGAAVNSEKRAVREAVEKLQESGMVYIKEGRLYPL